MTLTNLQVFIPVVVFGLGAGFKVFTSWRDRKRERHNLTVMLMVFLRESLSWISRFTPGPRPTVGAVDAVAHVYAEYIAPDSISEQLKALPRLPQAVVEDAFGALSVLRLAVAIAVRYLGARAAQGGGPETDAQTQETGDLLCSLDALATNRITKALRVLDARKGLGTRLAGRLEASHG